jgi:hypothetical protein
MTDIKYENDNKELIASGLNILSEQIAVDVNKANSVKNKRKPSSHGDAAHKVREHVENNNLLKMLMSDDTSELKDMLDEL